jgi:hypothetical protein
MEILVDICDKKVENKDKKYPLRFVINMDKVFESLYLISQRGLQKFLQEV